MLNVHAYALNNRNDPVPLFHGLASFSQELRRHKNVAYTPVQLNLPVSEIAKHFLHFCFFCVLKGGLFTQSLIAKGIGGFVGRRDSFVQLLYLSAKCYGAKSHTYFIDLSIQFLHLFNPASVIIRASDCVHFVPKVCAKAQA